MMGDNPVRGLVSARQLPALRGQPALAGSHRLLHRRRQARSARIHVGDGPSALAFSAAGHLLFVVDARSGDVAVVRTANCGKPLARPASSCSLFTMLPAGRNPNSITVKAFRAS